MSAKFLYAPNLVSDQLRNGLDPWDFKAPEEISLQIRKVKEDRQNWYSSPNTNHYFYSGIEPVNPNLRVSKENNPPIAVNAFVADYDLNVPDQRIDEAIALMPVKPAWVERSLGGNFRLIWLLASPLRTAEYDFTVFVLQEARDFLKLGLLPGLDEPAFVTATRLYCNGLNWRATGHGPIKPEALQAFFVECGRKFRFRAPDDANIPLDLVESELKKKFENFDWPDAFEVGSQGPSFWIPGSVSSKSAILKPGGMFTFSAHAEQPFYPWSKILGAEFVKEFENASITKATKDCYWDTKKYWRLLSAGYYQALEKPDFVLFLKVDCRLSSKPGSSGVSPIDMALQHIHNHAWIKNAAPFVFRRPGPIEFLGERRLNTYTGKPISPAEGKQQWGPQGNFPFISKFLDSLFDPKDPQLTHFLAWCQYYFRSAFEWLPYPGQYATFSGGVGCGKTFLSRRIIGTAVGGFADASDFLVEGASFNSHLIRCGHWCLDDDNPGNSPGSRSKAAAMFKKMTGNQQFLCHEKFHVPGMVEWMGRIVITTNLDFTSLRILGSLDNNALDKMCLFKCVDRPGLDFPKRYDLEKIISRELPYFLRWLLDWTVPDFILPDPRYGYKAFHHSGLMDRTHQGSTVAPFKELLLEALAMFFMTEKNALEYSGTATQIHRLITMDPRNENIMRSYKPEQINRYLEQLQSEKLIPCSASSGADKSRIWTFQRVEPSPSTSTTNINFSSTTNDPQKPT